MKFSVSMSVYNGDNSEHFKTALDSVFNQTAIPDEVVLVVDGPVNENINTVITDFENTYETLKVVRLPQNMGHGEARRAGLSACSNNLVAIMDADDICLSYRFEKQLDAFKHNPDLTIVGGQITEFIDTPDNVAGIRNVPLLDSEIKKYMKKRCPMNQVTVMFKRNVIEHVGGYLDWYCEEDYYLWIRMGLANAIFQNLPETLVNVRVGKDMYKRRGGLKYFKSEAKLQKYMLDNKIIGVSRYLINVLERLILQVLMPNNVRGLVFKLLARKKVGKDE